MKNISDDLLDVIKDKGFSDTPTPNSNPLINYDNPEQAKRLMSGHLAKIFMATHKKKLQKEIEKLKALCN
ncbi:MAG: hypothetical protein AB7T22_13285 [Calditrichaceae bacterium]